MVTIQLNGQAYQLDRAATVATLLAAQGGEAGSSYVAVAVNGKVVPRREWEQAQLRNGDDVLVVRPVAGGTPL